ncbi:MAG: YihY/virulence factor BrkB family protein [Candidatus Sabulitectum sp.]|nr:YihY/virulence factor BrkB family protein [Candidatus Sabulitectum sp.]
MAALRKVLPWGRVRSVTKHTLQVTGRFFHRFYLEWGRDNVYFGAAAIAFNVLVTLIPLTVLIFQFSALAVMGDLSFREEFMNWLTGLNPFVPEAIIADLENAVLGGGSTISIIGFVTLLWMVSRLFGTIRTALDKVFEAPGRHIVWGKLYDFLLAILVALCFIFAAVFTIAAKFAAGSTAGEFLTSMPTVGPALSGFLARILSLTFTFLVFFLLYWAAPNKAMPKRMSALMALLAMTLTTLGTEIYMRAVSAPDWGIVYGSFISIMATLIWLYWLCVIFIGSAEVGSVIYQMRTKQKT